MALDISLFRIVNGFAGRFDGLDAIGIFAAVFLLPLLGVLLFLATFTVKGLREEHWYEMPLKAIVAGGIGYVIRLVVGALVARPRPFVGLQDVHALVLTDIEEAYRSFPSGHATLAFAIAITVYKQDRDWGIAFLILAAIVAIGRVFVGVHFPVDVIAGALLGIGSAWVVHVFEKKEWRKIERALRMKH
ncbi:MAG: phosphatase PAP2 family protein [bacterium]|nr:phosphatase PAP2 family protein [bacterium]